MDRMNGLLSGFTERSKEILRDNLVGIYLHGSAVMGCFNPAKSDVDIIVVIRKPMSDATKRDYMDMVAQANAMGPKKGIEMSVVTSAACNPFVYPTPFELHFSTTHLNWYRENPDEYILKMKGTDRDLAAHFTVIGKRGRCLYGASIKDVFAEVPHCDYMDSIWNDIAHAQSEIAENTMYLVLNLARVLAYKEENCVLSKKEGGEWAMGNIPGEYRPLIQEALREYTEGADVAYDVRLAKAYAAYMLGRIREQRGR